MIKDLWDVAQGLMGLRSNFAKAKQQRKDRIAEYFITIGNTIQEAAEIFKQGEVPHGKCQQMLDHALYFVDTVGDTLDQARADAFQEKLIESHEIELLASEVLGNDDPSKAIEELEKISGSFLSLGAALKAGL